MTGQGDETEEIGADAVSAEGKSGRIARARARAEEAKRAGAEILEREQARRKSVWVAVEAYSQDRRFAGGLLAGGLAFRLFLWLLPFSLVVVTLFGGLADNLEQPASELAHDAGLSAALASSVAIAVESSEQGRLYLLAAGVVLLIWAGMGVVKAMRLVSGLAWELPPKTTPHNPFLESALVVVVVVVALGAHLVALRLGAGFLRGEVLLFMAESALVATLMVWVFWKLPHSENATWTTMIPGALLVTVGIGVVRLVTAVYFADRLDRVTDLYGALGVASVFLAWLYIIGRLLVAGISLNASTFNASTSRPIRQS